MGSTGDRSKKRTQLWKKAIIQFSLCFLMGFFTGFAPSTTTSIFFSLHPSAAASGGSANASVASSGATGLPSWSRSTSSKVAAAEGPLTSSAAAGDEEDDELQRPLIVITTTRSAPAKGAFLERLARTLRSVAPPLLWIVVEASSPETETAEVLRGTGVMYRHLVFKKEMMNFTDDPTAEDDHQRNVALRHVERHRLAGVVVFADVDNVYELGFFQAIRSIETFGAWPVAMVSAGRKYVTVEGPLCSSSQVIGWRTKDTVAARPAARGGGEEAGNRPEIPATINVWGFAFNSSVLWDPERWGRTSPVPDTIQDLFKFVRQIALEDDTKMKGIPVDCSRVMLWHLINAPPLPRWSFSSQAKL